MRPDVSVVIPVYNSKAFLDCLINSVLGQTLTNIEIICVDDGSTDGSGDILRYFADSDHRIQIIEKENGGEGSARNAGLRHAAGEYVCFFDSDDFVDRNMLEEMVSCARANTSDLVICAIDAYYEESDIYKPNEWAVSREAVPVGVAFDPLKIEDLFRHIVGYAANKLYRTSFVLDNDLLFQEIRTHGDLSFSYAGLAAAKRVVYIDTPFYHHRIRKGSLSDTTQESHWHCLFEALDNLRSELYRLDIWSECERDFANYVLQMAKWKFSRVGGQVRVDLDEGLRSEWFPHLGVLTYPKDLFYNKDCLAFLEDTMSLPYMDRQEKELERLRLLIADQDVILANLDYECDQITMSASYKIGHALLRPFWLLKRAFSVHRGR